MKPFWRRMNKELTSFVKAWEAAVRKSAGPKKRANSIFTPMSVAHVDDDDDARNVLFMILHESNGNCAYVVG